MSGVFSGLFRIGRDAELRYTSNGDVVASLSLAYTYGIKKNADGYLPSQWIEAALWGKRAESLVEYLTKGTRVFAVIEDLHIETYDKRDGGQGHKLTGRIQNIEFAGDGARSGDGERQKREPTATAQGEPRAAAPAIRASSQAAQRAAFEDDDIPF